MASPLKKSIWRRGITHSTLKRLPGTVYVNRSPRTARRRVIRRPLCVWKARERVKSPKVAVSGEGRKAGWKGRNAGDLDVICEGFSFKKGLKKYGQM